MAKLNGPYSPQDLSEIQTGRRMTAEQYEQIVLNQHAIYAAHRARCPGWRWTFTTASSTLTTTNSTAGQPDLNWYQPRIVIQRQDGSNNLIASVHIYGQNYEVDAGIYFNGSALGSVTMTGTATLEWTEFPINLGAASVALPVDFYFRARATSGTATILRIIPDEPTLTGVANIP